MLRTSARLFRHEQEYVYGRQCATAHGVPGVLRLLDKPNAAAEMRAHLLRKLHLSLDNALQNLLRHGHRLYKAKYGYCRGVDERARAVLQLRLARHSKGVSNPPLRSWPDTQSLYDAAADDV